MKQPPLLILVTGDPVPAVHTEMGDFATLIRNAVGSVWTGSWRIADMRAALPDGTDWAGAIITGSPESLTEPKPWMEDALNYVRSLVALEVPVLGICFGHQMLGVALGGRVENNPNGREIGTVELTLRDRDPLLERAFGPEPKASFDVNMTHMDSIVQLPAGARVLASTALEPHAMVRFSSRALGVQFHPEIDRRAMHGYIDHRREQIATEGFDVDALHSTAQDTPSSVGLMQAFVRSLS
jgi:GMP synthase (glutamine-hydrolysing)